MSVFDSLAIPNLDNVSIYPGSIVRLGRFSSEQWRADIGWYTWGGNRPVCGWYLTSLATGVVKPLQLTDLDDMYTVETTG